MISVLFFAPQRSLREPPFFNPEIAKESISIHHEVGIPLCTHRVFLHVRGVNP